MSKKIKIALHIIWAVIGLAYIITFLCKLNPFLVYHNIEGGYTFAEYVFLGNVVHVLLSSLAITGIVSLVFMPITCFNYDNEDFPKITTGVGIALAIVGAFVGSWISLELFNIFLDFISVLVIGLMVGCPFVIGALVEKSELLSKIPSKLLSVFLAGIIISLVLSVASFINSAFMYYIQVINTQAWVLGPIALVLGVGALSAFLAPTTKIIILIFKE